MVECDLAKVEVAGSNPVSRSKRYEALSSGKGFSLPLTKSAVMASR